MGNGACPRLCCGSKISALLWTDLSTIYYFFSIKSCWRGFSCLTLIILWAPWITSKSSSFAWCARYFLLESKLAMSMLKVKTIPHMFSYLYKYHFGRRMFLTELPTAHKYRQKLSKGLLKISCLPSRKFKIGMDLLHVVRPHLYILQEAAPENSIYHFSLLQTPQKFELFNHALCFLLSQRSCGVE